MINNFLENFFNLLIYLIYFFNYFNLLCYTMFFKGFFSKHNFIYEMGVSTIITIILVTKM